MTNVEIFRIVDVGRFILPSMLSLLIFWFASRPVNTGARAATAIVPGWILTFLYTIYVYNSAGIAAGHEQGMHFPENRYDNNTVSVALIAGWFYPAFTVLVFITARKAWQRFSGNTPNKSFKRTP